MVIFCTACLTGATVCHSILSLYRRHLGKVLSVPAQARLHSISGRNQQHFIGSILVLCCRLRFASQPTAEVFSVSLIETSVVCRKGLRCLYILLWGCSTYFQTYHGVCTWATLQQRECSASSHSHFAFLQQEPELQQCLSRVVTLYLIKRRFCTMCSTYALSLNRQFEEFRTFKWDCAEASHHKSEHYLLVSDLKQILVSALKLIITITN